MAKLLIALVLAAAPGLALSAGGGNLESAQTRITDRASLQRGAALFVNYCMGCHSLDYLRYSRLAADLHLTEEQVMENLNFGQAKFGEQMTIAMDPDDAQVWFGAPPPDLSVIARVRGSDWIFTYLKSFYIDESRPLGWNNAVFPNASMPHVLWELQGLQHRVGGGTGEAPHLEIAEPGSLSADQYDQVVRDITNFLQYAGEPAVLERRATGAWVLFFLAFFTFLAWLLKKEYWRDVH